MNIHINMSHLSKSADWTGRSLSNRLGLTDAIFQREKEKEKERK